MRSAGLCMPISSLPNAVAGPYRLARSCCERVLFRDAARLDPVAMASGPHAGAGAPARPGDECGFTAEGWRSIRKARVARVAERQRGRIRYDQLRALGISDTTIRRWTAEGYLHRELRRVYAVGHPGRTPESDLAAALLYAGPGAALSHGTAI